ncbi:hypothetical protein [Enterobacter roggenkampii]|uniref:hypothetical protein n=1 Tax=Enterobacter roggenkampii TaxID=1812935 RepID=UPI001F1F9016|nr:hypothetical protein [Enterobacter roggenkampii]
MSNKYEVLIKNARVNAECGEHMSPTEVTTLLNVVETTFAALAAENAGLKEWSPNPHSASMYEAIEKAEELMDDGMPELAMIEAFEILKMKRTPATDAFLAEVRAHDLNAFIRHHSAELDAHIKNGGEQFNEKSVRIRDIIVSARLFREQIRKEAAQ